jgi:hypothetical protein
MWFAEFFKHQNMYWTFDANTTEDRYDGENSVFQAGKY